MDKYEIRWNWCSSVPSLHRIHSISSSLPARTDIFIYGHADKSLNSDVLEASSSLSELMVPEVDPSF